MQSVDRIDRLKPTLERAKLIAANVASADEVDYLAWSDRVQTDGCFAYHVAETKQPQWIMDAQFDQSISPPCIAGSVDHFRSALGVPVLAPDGVVCGVLIVVWRRPRVEQSERLTLALVVVAEMIAQDIDRLATIEALEEAQRRSDILICSTPLSLMMIDRDMRLLEATPRWLADFDARREDLMGRSLYDIDPEHFEKFRALFDRSLAGETVKVGRLRLPQINGRHRWLQAETSPWFEANGEVGGLIGAALDITDTVEALEKAERSALRLQLATELAELHVWEIDYERGTLETAGARESFFDREYVFEDLIANPVIAIDTRDRSRISAEAAQAMIEGRPHTAEYRVARDDGREVWAACRAQLIRDEQGNPHRLLGAMQNITERKAADHALVLARDEAQDANFAKTNFLATMSHEIRTPLNGVLGMTQAMAADELTDDQRLRLEVIQKSGESLLSILNDMLDLSKIEAGKLVLEEVEFELEEIAGAAHAIFTALADDKGLGFRLEIDGARGVYRGDPVRIRQVLHNLISNALKFTETGEIGVVIDYDGVQLIASISDSGIGMSDEMMCRLFEKFAQADASTTRRFGGTGLGLAICRQLADLMGGTIDVVSQLGRGSIFTFRIPLTRLGHSRGVEAPAPETETQAFGIRVLAAEDHAVNQLVLRSLLDQVGVSPLIVENGQLAVEAWEGKDWDVILMDVQMPVMDGPTAVRTIRAREAATGRRRTPVIALTANAMSHQIADYVASGMDGYVVKPIDASKLFEALEWAMDGADSSEAPAPLARAG